MKHNFHRFLFFI